MPGTADSRAPALEGFDSFEHAAGGLSRPVYVAGEGPAIVLIHELPSITPALLTLARVLGGAGFTTFLPSLMGVPGHGGGGAASLAGALRLCAAREFSATLADGETRPIVLWLRSLVAEAARRRPQHPKVGVIGLCFSGGFALGAATESAVAGAVACEPSLPFIGQRRLGVGAPDVETLNHRIAEDGLAVRVYRFEGDDVSPCERMLELGAALPQGLEGRCLPDGAANPANRRWPPHHSVITTHLIDEAGQPTRQARDEIVAFFQWRLSDGPAPQVSPPALRDCLRNGCARGRKLSSE